MAAVMTSQRDIDKIVAECSEYWTATGVPRKTARDMTAELTAHLYDSVAAGNAPATVIGPDVRGFAESWASAYRDPRDPSQFIKSRQSQPWPWWTAIGATALVIAAALAVGKDSEVDEVGIQIAFWAATAVALAIGEIFTAGFFLISFAAGAGVAAALAAAGVNPPTQIVAFLIVSVIGLLWTRKYAIQDRPPLIPVGANRFLGKQAVVERDISRHTAGRVRIGSEDWRAVTDADEVYETGTTVKIVAIRGTSLVVTAQE